MLVSFLLGKFVLVSSWLMLVFRKLMFINVILNIFVKSECELFYLYWVREFYDIIDGIGFVFEIKLCFIYCVFLKLVLW